MKRARRHVRALTRIALIVAQSVVLIGVRVLALPAAWIWPPLDRRVLNALVRAWSTGAARIMGISCTVLGEAPVAPVLLVSNHLSYVDVVVISRVWDGAFVAKSEVASWPGVSLLARIAGTIFIDRNRKRDLLRVIHEMTTRLAQGRSVLFFPEATSSPGAEILPFHSSLFEAAHRSGADVVAATLRYEVSGAESEAAAGVCWWGGMTFPDHAYALLSLPKIRASLRFGSKRLRAGDRKQWARVARAEVVSLFEPTQGSERYRDLALQATTTGVGTRRPDLASIS